MNTLSVNGNADIVGALTVNEDLNTGGRISDKTGPVMPVGAVIAWVGTTGSTNGYLPITPPQGWLICDGNAIPTQYADLIALVGANTPNLCGRTLIGTGQPNNNTQTDGTTPNFALGNNWPVGYTGGEFQHTLVVGEMPAHNHTVGGYNKQPNNIADNDDDISCPDCWMWNDAKETTYTGGNLAHNTMQPYFAINYIIKC